MKASKFTEAQIAFVLRQAEDGTPIAEICRKAGISDATFYNWRKKYAGLSQHDPRRPGIGVRLPRSRYLDLPEGCRA